MKKLMIALAVVVMAVVSQAVQFKWTTGTGLVAAGETATMQNGGTLYLIDGLAANGGITAAALYLIDSSTANGGISAANFLAALTAETPTSFADLVASYAIKSATVDSAGKIATTTWDNPANPNGDAYVGNTAATLYAVLQDGDNVFISKDMTQTVQATAETKYAFMLKTQSSSGKFETAYNANGGWYQTVPEPTSGLLLLLGVAGLALRRRRA